MGEILVLSISAAFSPTLFAAVMVMLLSTNAKRLMVGCLLGAYAVSFTLGLVIVLALPHSGAVSTTRNTLSPALDLVLGMIALCIAIVLASGLDERVKIRREQRKPAKEQKGPPRRRRALDEGSPRAAIAIGALLGFPGVSYLVALDLLHKQNRGAGPLSPRSSCSA
jgi:Sap, sulfolipid-1-addressing protein